MESPSSPPFPKLRCASERGDSLIELLVTIAVSVVVLGAVVMTLVLAERVQASTANYTYAQNQARAQLDAMVSQIRQAWDIVSAGPNYVDFDVNLQGAAYQVYYECDVPQAGTSYNECVRLQAAVGAQLPSLSSASAAITNLDNGTTEAPVFGWSPSSIAPYYMTASIEVPAADGATTHLGLGLNHAIAFSDGALMRNENVEN